MRAWLFKSSSRAAWGAGFVGVPGDAGCPFLFLLRSVIFLDTMTDEGSLAHQVMLAAIWVWIAWYLGKMALLAYQKMLAVISCSCCNFVGHDD